MVISLSCYHRKYHPLESHLRIQKPHCTYFTIIVDLKCLVNAYNGIAGARVRCWKSSVLLLDGSTMEIFGASNWSHQENWCMSWDWISRGCTKDNRVIFGTDYMIDRMLRPGSARLLYIIYRVWIGGLGNALFDRYWCLVMVERVELLWGCWRFSSSVLRFEIIIIGRLVRVWYRVWDVMARWR